MPVNGFYSHVFIFVKNEGSLLSFTPDGFSLFLLPNSSRVLLLFPLLSLLLLISPSASSFSSVYSFHSRNQKETIEHFLFFVPKFWEIQITEMWIYLHLNLTNKPERTMLTGSSAQLCSQPSAASQPQNTPPLSVTSGKPPECQVFHKPDWDNTTMRSNWVWPSGARGIFNNLIWVLWHTTVNPSAQKAEEGRSQIQGQPEQFCKNCLMIWKRRERELKYLAL